jgi:hypothetical protein
MRYTQEIEEAIVAQIQREPEREVILPDWCYWKGIDTPWIYREQIPTRLVVVLHERLIGALPEGAGLARKPGTDPRNVNPHLWVVVPGPRARAVCDNGHEYGQDDWIEGVGHRCQTCRAERALRREGSGQPSPAAVNRAKTHCPQEHEYTPENTIRLKSGRRRCKTCHRQQQAASVARKKGTA